MVSVDEALTQIKDYNKGLRESIEEELLRIRYFNRDVRVNLNSSGFVVYRLGDNNIILATVHNGHYTPEGITFYHEGHERYMGEDVHTGELYLPIFLEKGGIWITTHVSRYFADLNRKKEEAIFSWGSPDGEYKNFREISCIRHMTERAITYHDDFYQQIISLLNPDSFLFSGHSMEAINNGIERGDFCLFYKREEKGRELKRLLEAEGFNDVRINNPFTYGRGFLIYYANQFINGSVQFETNKRLYLKGDGVSKSEDFEDVSRRIANAVGNYLNHV